jgi:2-keto-4-pentenoate hydratase
MVELKIGIQTGHYIWFFSLFLILFIIGCQSGETDLNKDHTDQLAAGADIEEIAEHLLQVRQAFGVTRALALHYPNLDRDKAYKIQMTMLSKLEKQGERLVGWKMGGSRVTDPDLPFNPNFGFMLASDEFQSGSMASSTKFVVGCPLVEAEIGFLLKKDLPGPVTSRDELIDAIESVGGFCELISVRTRDAEGGTKATSAQFIADGLSHGGFIQPKQKFVLDEIDLKTVESSIVINGEIKSEGESKDFAFLDAILYLANNLPKYDRYLRSGDIIITVSTLTPPEAQAEDKVEIKFSTFEPLYINFE